MTNIGMHAKSRAQAQEIVERFEAGESPANLAARFGLQGHRGQRPPCNQLAQAGGQRTALRAVPGTREPPDDDPSGAA
jgi:hypothetical protein